MYLRVDRASDGRVCVVKHRRGRGNVARGAHRHVYIEHLRRGGDGEETVLLRNSVQEVLGIC